jgi:hypothetical protein
MYYQTFQLKAFGAKSIGNAKLKLWSGHPGVLSVLDFILQQMEEL